MKIAIASRGDKKNETQYYPLFKNSFLKFHKDVDFLFWDQDKINTYQDPAWFYRASPIIGREIIDKYDLICLADVDQIIMGNLDHIFNGDYDIGTVLNINRYDPTKYGIVQFQGINPNEYYNNGFVAIRNTAKGKNFLEEWYRLCHSKYFHRLQYREQDILNVLAHYGNYNVRNFDDYNVPNQEFCWNGLVSKGEWHRAELRGKDVVIPKGIQDNYPDRDVILKIIHFGGGQEGTKMNYRVWFSEPMVRYIDWLVSDSDKPYETA